MQTYIVTNRREKKNITRNIKDKTYTGKKLT